MLCEKGNVVLSDSPYLKDKKKHNRHTIPDTHYSDRQKIEAVTTYLMLGGNVALTCATLKINQSTLYYWTKSEWWNDLVHSVRKEEKLQLSARLKKIVEKSWEVVEDRLTNGDYIYDQKQQCLVRKPVPMKDAASVAKDASTLRINLDIGEASSTHNDAIEEKLTKLAKAFSDLSRGITNNQAVEDIAFNDNGDNDNAVYDKRKTRLQAGEPAV